MLEKGVVSSERVYGDIVMVVSMDSVHSRSKGDEWQGWWKLNSTREFLEDPLAQACHKLGDQRQDVSSSQGRLQWLHYYIIFGDTL